MKFEIKPELNHDNEYKAGFFDRSKFKEKASFFKTASFLLLLTVLGLSENVFGQKKISPLEMEKLRTECTKNEKQIKEYLEENGQSTNRFNFLLKTSWVTKKVEFKDGTSVEAGSSSLNGEKQNDFLIYFGKNAEIAYFDANSNGTVDRLIVNKNNMDIETKKKEALYLANGIVREQDGVSVYFFDENDTRKFQYADLKEGDFSFVQGDNAEKVINLTQEKFSELTAKIVDELK